jgi:membrane associated rhomboid family serine protease
MIPIGDNTPRRLVPWINYTIIGLCFLVFLLELSLGDQLDAFIRAFGVTPAFISAKLNGDPRLPNGVLITPVTALFLHAGWLHILGNMLFVWIFGDNVEDRLGHLGYLFFYVFCGVGANLAQVAVDTTSQIPLIGASGAIAAVLGAYLVLYPRAWITVLVPVLFIIWPISVPVIIVLGFWFISQLGNGVAAITEASQATGGVGYWAHIGGFILGALLIYLLPKAPASTRVAQGRFDAPGCPRWLRGLIVAVGNAVTLLIVARLAFGLLLPSAPGVLAVVEALVIGITNPLVLPFAWFLPAIRLDGSVLELYALLALLVYQLLIGLIMWVLGLICGRAAAPTYYRD